MKLKTVTVEGKVYAETKDGNPLYEDEAGKEIAFDAPHAIKTINETGLESKAKRKALGEAEAKLKEFDGIDPAAARKALETIKNIDESKLIEAGKVDEIKKNAEKAANDRVAAAQEANQKKLDEATAETTKLTKTLHSEMIGGRFARSTYIAEKTILPGPAAEKIFGDAFKIEDGNVVAYGPDGKPVYSRAKPGSNAEFEEAIEILVDTYPFRDSILKGTGGGSGAKNGHLGSGNGKTMKREEFEKLDPIQRQKVFADKIQVVDA